MRCTPPNLLPVVVKSPNLLFFNTISRSKRPTWYADKREVTKFSFKTVTFKAQPKISCLVLLLREKEGKCVFFLLLFLTAAGGAFIFLVANGQHADKNQLVRRWTLDFDIDSAQGQPAWCRARPTRIGGGLENTTWVHGLRGESLPAASCGILSNLKEIEPKLCHSRRIEKFCHLVLCTPAVNCFSYA